MYFLTILKVEKSNIKVLGDSISGEACLSGLQVAAFSWCPHMAGGWGLSGVSYPYLGPTLMTSFNLTYLFVVPMS